MFLQEDPQLAVTLLNVLVEAFQGLPKSIGQYAQHDAARHEDSGKHAIQRNDHDDRRDEADDGSCQARQDLHDPVCDHRGVVGQAIQPFRRVGGGNGAVFLAQDVVRQPLLEAVFDVRLRQLVQPAGNGGETDLQDHQSNNQHDIVPERAVVTPHRAVHNVPQEQGEEDSQASADCLNQRQNQYISFFLPVTRQSHRTALSTAHRFHAKKPPDKGETFTFA